MKKVILIFVLLLYSFPCLAIPARLGGFSYSKDEHGRPRKLTDHEGTSIFNEGPPAYFEDLPPIPFYLNEDLSDARTGVARQGDKYELAPVYTEKTLRENGGYIEEGFIEDDYSEDEFFDEEEEFVDDEDLFF